MRSRCSNGINTLQKKTNIRLNKSFNLIFSLIFFKQLLQWNQTHVSELKSFKSLREDKLLLRLLCYLMNLQTGFFPATQQQVDLCCVVLSSQQHVARTLIQMIRLLLSDTETKNVSERPLTSVHIYLLTWKQLCDYMMGESCFESQILWVWRFIRHQNAA